LYFELIDALSVYVAADRSLDLSNNSYLLLVVESSELWSLQERLLLIEVASLNIVGVDLAFSATSQRLSHYYYY